MSRVGLIVLVGVPGAGKTTFCQLVKEYLRGEESPWKTVHFCFDDFIRIDGEDRLENGHYKMQRKRLLECLDQLVDAIKTNNLEQFNQVNKDLQQVFSQNLKFSLSEGSQTLILVDDNMYYRSMRYEVFRIARKYGVGYAQLYLDVPLEEAMFRNSRRETPVPSEVISRMWSRLEGPNERLCSWEKNSLQVGNLDEEFKPLLSKILEFMEHPIPILIDLEVKLVEQSIVHKFDLLLRKSVGELIEENRGKTSADELKVLSEQLITKRKSILNDFRNGLIEMNPEHVTNEQICLLLM